MCKANWPEAVASTTSSDDTASHKNTEDLSNKAGVRTAARPKYNRGTTTLYYNAGRLPSRVARQAATMALFGLRPDISLALSLPLSLCLSLSFSCRSQACEHERFAVTATGRVLLVWDVWVQVSSGLVQ